MSSGVWVPGSITQLTGDVSANGPGTANAIIANTVNRVYVDLISGNDSTGTGSPWEPWKTLQHAYNSISPTINEPITIILSGGNNDTDITTITGKPNAHLFCEYPIQLKQPIVISGGITNDVVAIQNILLSGLTWVRNDSTAISLYLMNCSSSGLIDFEQQGGNVAQCFLTVQSGGLAGGLTVRAGQANIFTQAIYGNVLLKDAGPAYYLFNGADLYTAVFTVEGGASLYMYGCIPDSGYSITGTTTASGTPTLIADGGSLPSSISGSVNLQLTALSQYVSYTAGAPSKWASPAPTTVKAAIDRIAAVVGNTTPIP